MDDFAELAQFLSELSQRLELSQEVQNHPESENQESDDEAYNEECDDDWLLSMFRRNHHLILENILSALPAESIMSCRKVNKHWNKMILFYLKSTNPRTQKIQDSVISHQWLHQPPTIKRQLALGARTVYAYCDMISDEKNIVITAWKKTCKKPVIFVLNAGDLKLITIIEPFQRFPNLKSGLGYQLCSALTNEFLYFSFVKAGAENKQYYSILAWDRLDNFKYLDDQKIAAGPVSHRLAFSQNCISGITAKMALKPVVCKNGIGIALKMIRESNQSLYYGIRNSKAGGLVVNYNPSKNQIGGYHPDGVGW
jgi:hypothetical protein